MTANPGKVTTSTELSRLADGAAVASAWALFFAALLVALAIVSPPSAAQRLAADPLLRVLEGRGGAWLVVAAAIAIFALLRRGNPLRVQGARWAIAGAIAGLMATLLVRALVGPRLPPFIPSEESARPGVTLGLSAGLLEEVVFRLTLLPGIALAAGRRMAGWGAVALAVIVTSALFSLSHELGPGGGVFDGRLMATRFVFPGVVMSILAVRVNMTFLVCAHCSAHLLIPLLFSG